MTDEVKKFGHWRVSSQDLVSLSPLKARDLVIKCFFEAQKETFARANQNLGKQGATDDGIMQNVTMAVKMVFKENGSDFDNPSRESLRKVVESLARKAGVWGTPQDIIDHHKGEIEKILKAL